MTNSFHVHMQFIFKRLYIILNIYNCIFNINNLTVESFTTNYKNNIDNLKIFTK